MGWCLGQQLGYVLGASFGLVALEPSFSSGNIKLDHIMESHLVCQ